MNSTTPSTMAAWKKVCPSSDDATLSAIIVNGRANTAMEGFPDLTEEEVAGLIQMIRGWQ